MNRDAPHISAPTLQEAFKFVAAEPERYAFQNSWLIDPERRITHFMHGGEHIIAKRSTPEKASLEVRAAEQASRLLRGTRVGRRALVAEVPRLQQPDAESNDAYLAARFIGPDLNEQYYVGGSIDVTAREWGVVLDTLAQKGIRYPGLLPRNVIASPDRITIVDWESARFANRPCWPDRLTWTGMAIGWSYFYGRSTIESALEERSSRFSIEPDTTPYERLYGQLLGIDNDVAMSRDTVCAMAVDAEADRGYGKLPYRLDDAFHVIGELLPTNIEVTLDILLSLMNDQEHWRAAKCIGSIARRLHTESAGGAIAAEHAVATFRSRCARLLVRLASEPVLPPHTQGDEITAIDRVCADMHPAELAQALDDTLVRYYPCARPHAATVLSVAKSAIGAI